MVEVITLVLFRVQGQKKTKVLHHDLLKRCFDRELPLWLQRARKNLDSPATASQESDPLWGLQSLFQGSESDPAYTGLDDPKDSVSGDTANAELLGNVMEDIPSSDPAAAGLRDGVVDEYQTVRDVTWVQCEHPDCLKWRKISVFDAEVCFTNCKTF